MRDTDKASACSARAPIPCRSTSCATMSATASSSSPLPGMHSTGFSAPPLWRQFSCGLAGRLGLGNLGERRLLRFGFGRHLCLILVRAEIVDDFRDRIADAQHVFVADQSPVRIGLGELEAFEEHLVVVGGKRFFLEDGFGLFGGLDRVARQHALIDQLCRRQGRLVAQHHVEKFEAVDVAAEHDEADGQRDRQNEADRSPQPGPERGGGDHRDGRKAGATAEQQRFDDMPGERLDNHEQEGGP